MHSRYLIAIMLVILSVTTFALASGDNNMDKSTKNSLDKLKDTALYFGHQSVGYNIVEGVTDLLSDNQIEDYRIVDISRDRALLRGKGFFHSQLGTNGDTKSKIVGFKNIIDEERDRIDVAFFKFCYVDINNDTDANALFTNYKNTMDDLIKTYPSILFLHITAPLRVVQSGPKAWVKSLLKKPLGGAADNVKRNQFNHLMKDAYAASGHVFDLAKAESTLPDGQANQFVYQGKEYRSLVNEYTDDGKHLNAVGRKAVAQQLLLFLGKQAL